MIFGIDEVGRGAWAGPLLVCCVALTDNHKIVGLRDSKKLSLSSREHLAVEIKKYADYIGFGWVRASEIDELGLSGAMKCAVERAVGGAVVNDTDEIIMDGAIDYLKLVNSRAVVKAEDTYDSVAAASIVAKAARDCYMRGIDVAYPGYAFDSHVGYGTKAHAEALANHGVTPVHRISFKPIQSLLP